VGRWLVICVVLGGCGQLLGIDDLDERPPCFADSFTVLDPARWAFTRDPSVVDVDLIEGSVVISPPPNLAGNEVENGIATVDTLDLTDATLTVTVHTQSSPELLQTFFLFDIQLGTGFGFITGDGKLNARTFTNGVDSNVPPLDFDPLKIFWRLRHDSERASIIFEISANLVDWDPIRVASGYPAPLLGTARLQGGVYVAPSADPGKAVFDAIELASDSCISASAD